MFEFCFFIAKRIRPFTMFFQKLFIRFIFTNFAIIYSGNQFPLIIFRPFQKFFSSTFFPFYWNRKIPCFCRYRFLIAVFIFNIT